MGIKSTSTVQKIENCTNSDLPEILRLYQLARDVQKIKFPGNVWPIFEPSLINADIAEKRLWKITINQEIACIWTVTFNDPQIWEEKDKDPAIYIHRIATNPQFKGQKFVAQIVTWARKFAPEQQKGFIRMDTCGKNDPLINYYKACGFDFLGIHKLKDTKGLPCHYIDAPVCFFQISL